MARALADKLRVRDLPSVTDPAPDEKYGLRLYMSPRRRPSTITAHHDGSFTVVKESTSQSGNPYRTEALATKPLRFDDEPTTDDIAGEIADTIESMRWWS